jgi:predicted NUDIX family NTP pyrophosphohydrolase
MNRGRGRTASRIIGRRERASSAPGRPQSAGALVYRSGDEAIEVLLVHPGGPYWRSRNRGWWQIPKGLIEPGEEAETAARREAEEELGVTLAGPFEPLGRVRQAGGKWVEAFATRQDIDPRQVASNTFTIEWPRGSGRQQSFPEIDEARWFTLAEAVDWMLPSQLPFLQLLSDRLQEQSAG